MLHLASRSLRRAGLVAVAGGLLIPAAASADALVSAGPVKVRDYQMTVTASDGKTDSLSVMFTRADGKASQTHMYSFTKGINVKVAGNLGSATVKGSLGRYGAVKLRLSGAGPAKRYGVPKGCVGKGSKGRAGALKGSFKLVADSTYFKTISKKSLKGQVFKSGAFTCGTSGSGGSGGGDGTTGGLTLSAFSQTAGAGMLTASVTKAANGTVTQQAIRMEDAAATAPASIMRFITAPAASSTFTTAADLSSATVKGASRFLTGEGVFTSEGGGGSVASGALTGTLTARFDSIGDQALTAPTATLMQR